MQISPVDLRQIEKKAANVYECINVVSKRARQLNDEIKLEYQSLSKNIAPTSDPNDEEEKENPDQLRLSLDFEKRPKPHIKALNEFLSGDIKYRYKEHEF
ncbi:MAG TPA: DNA-directed RNA polymerase subunit omega [Melioribacteraceae bacterium]|nr:DNA-directed RNA polymerase subunit omega [Melioribacteraceae bacterium]